VSRSYLFVPGDSARKLERGASSEADALIVDLEDSVAAAEKPRARSIAREFLGDRPDKPVWVRINPLATRHALEDLREIMPAAPVGIMLPKSGGARDAQQLSKLLDVFEQESGIAAGRTQILPITTETPSALFHMNEYAGSSGRLAALTWGAEDLSAALGSTAIHDDQGEWLPQYELARSLCLIAAAAAELPAVDTVCTNFRDHEALQRRLRSAVRDGFSGMLAIHPDQVGLINQGFAPSEDDIVRARRIVELFESGAGIGVAGMDGEMLDRPHLIRARRILAMAGE